MSTVYWYIVAAVAEISGCFAFWAWMRQGRSGWWVVPGLMSLTVFALVLAKSEAVFAGRAYAAYGGIYIVASLLWLWGIERISPDRWDVLGAGLCLVGAGMILWGPRAA